MNQASVYPVPSGKRRLNHLRRVSTQGWREPRGFSGHDSTEGDSLKAYHYVMIYRMSMGRESCLPGGIQYMPLKPLYPALSSMVYKWKLAFLSRGSGSCT